MKIAILDYSTGILSVIQIPHYEHEQNIIDHLTDMGFNTNNIHYMEVKSVNIEFTL